MKRRDTVRKKYVEGIGLLLLIPLFLLPLIQFPPAYNYVLVKLSLFQFFILLSLILLLIYWREQGRIEIPWGRSVKILLFLGAWNILGALFSPYPYISVRYLSFFLSGLLYFFLLLEVFSPLSILPLILVLLIPFYFFLPKETIYYIQTLDPDIASTFGNPNFFAAYLIGLFPLALTTSLHLISKGKKIKFAGIFLFLFSLLAIFLIYAVRSRAGGVGLVGGLLALLFLYREKWRRRKISWVAIVLVLILAGGIIIQKGGEIRANIKKDLEKGTLGIRIRIWEGTWRMILRRPLVGWGPGTFLVIYPKYRVPEYFLNPHAVNATDHAHNEFLEMWSETGIVGIFLFILLIVFSIQQGNKGIRRTHPFLYSGIVSGVWAILINNLFGVNFRYASTFFLFFTYLAILNLGIEERKVYPFRLKFPLFTGFMLIFSLGSGLLFFTVGVKPNVSQVHLKKGIILRNQRKWNRAIREYILSLLWDKGNLRARYRLAFAYASIGEVDKALEEYHKLKEYAPHYAEIDFNLGALYLKKGEFYRAEYYLREMLRLNPYHSAARANLGLLYKQTGRIDSAIKEFEKAIELDPRLYPAYWDLAELYRIKKDYKKALYWLEKLRKLKGEDGKLNSVIRILRDRIEKEGNR